MGVAIDQAGQHPGFRKIDHRGAGGDGHLGRRSDPGDALSLHHQHHVVAQAVAGRVEKMPGADVNRRRHGGRGRGSLRWRKALEGDKNRGKGEAGKSIQTGAPVREARLSSMRIHVTVPHPLDHSASIFPLAGS